ncbi:MAG: DMT family transporter [Promethearchaeota archaeon]|nr:MAG: DMT family transporter [Candidatus Lokiarchaeota archaeon]
MILLYLLLVLMIFIWSLNFIFVDFAVVFISPLSIAFYRFLIASISFLGIDLFLKIKTRHQNELILPHATEHKKFSKNDWILIIIASLIGQSIYFFVLYSAVDLIGPSLPALFVCLLSPVVIAVLALFVFDEKLNKWKVFGFGVASIGSILLVTGGNFSNLTTASPDFLGYILALLTPIQWGIFTTLTKKIAQGKSTLKMLKYITYLATLELLVFLLLQGEMRVFFENFLNPTLIFIAIYIGLICHIIGYYIYQHSLKEMDSAKVASFLYIEPFITLIISMILQIKENIVIWNILGGIIVLGAVLIINSQRSPREIEKETETLIEEF